MHQLCILPLTFISIALLDRTRQQHKMHMPDLEQTDHAEPRPLLPIAFAPPENPRSECENVELFSLLSALQGEGGQGMRVMAFEPDSYPICIDTGASACLSNDASHFISLNPVQQMTINGIGSRLEVKGVGMIRWLVLDDEGNEVELTVKNTLLILDTPM